MTVWEFVQLSIVALITAHPDERVIVSWARQKVCLSSNYADFDATDLGSVIQRRLFCSVLCNILFLCFKVESGKFTCQHNLPKMFKAFEGTAGRKEFEKFLYRFVINQISI